MNKSVRQTILCLAAALFMAGCSTYQTAWDNRVGVFTYDQAVKELGAPDQQTKLTDGRTEADWISRFRPDVAQPMDSGFYNHPASFGPMQSGLPYHESTLRLTFTTNNILSNWSKN